jgi:hypothetical protein
MWIHRIHMFLGLPDPDPPVRIVLWIRILLSSFKKSKKNLDSYYFAVLRIRNISFGSGFE